MSDKVDLQRKIIKLEEEIRSLKRELAVTPICTVCGNVCV